MLNVDVFVVADDLQDYLSMQFPTARWGVAPEENPATSAPALRVHAKENGGRHAEVSKSFPVFDALDAQTGKFRPGIWARWARETLEALQTKHIA